MAFVVPSAEPQVALRVPAHRFYQGGRTAYTFALSLADLDGLLPQRVDEEVIKDANRRLTPGHARNIKEYLESRSDWVLGAILAGISPDAVRFEPYQSEDGKPSGRFGELRLLSNRINTLRLLDGQHRRRAIGDALSELAERRTELRRMVEEARRGGQDPAAIAHIEGQAIEATSQVQRLENASIPLVVYEEDDVSALRRMFADAAKTKPIDRVTTARFDDRDAFNLAAADLAAVSTLFAGRVELERSTVARTSESLVAFNQLAEVLRTLMYGYYGRVSRVRNMELIADRSPIVEAGLKWADEFLPAAREEFANLIEHPDDYDPIGLRKTSFAMNVSVMRVIAACYFEWRSGVSDDARPLAAFLRKQSFKPGVENSLLVKAGLVAPGGSSPVARRQEVQRAIRYIVNEAKKSTKT